MKPLPLLWLLLFGLQTVFAGTPTPATFVTAAEPGPFDTGGHEWNVAGGWLYSPIVATGGRPVLNYAQGNVSLGWMLTSPAPLWNRNWLRGNWEVLGNLFGTGVTTKGPGGFMAGARLLMRYNFVQPDSPWVPFFQLGGGGLGDNVYNHKSQNLVGSGFEFTLVADMGVRYFISPKYAVILMTDFEHVSNARTARRNVGINGGGGMLGMGCFF